MKPKPPADTKAGAKVIVTCRCGTQLRFTMPAVPISDSTRRIREILNDALRATKL